jgi:hypothetical protein
MVLVTTYRIKSHMTHEETGELMKTFANVGAAPGTTAHYVAADGSHGLVISETDDPAKGYRNILNYRQWVDFETAVVLPIDEAVPHIMDSLA